MSWRLNRRNFLGYSSAALAASLLLKACTSPDAANTSASSGSKESSDFRVEIALPGVITECYPI